MANGKSSLACPKCDFVGKSVQSLKVHIGRAHGVGRRSRRRRGSVAKGRAAGAGRGTGCVTCGRSFKTNAAMKAHVTRFHGGTAAQGLPPLQQQLLGLSLADLADLYEACRAELRRRLMD